LEIPGVSLRTNGDAVGTGVLCGSKAMSELTASDCATGNPCAQGLRHSDRPFGVGPDAGPFRSACRARPESSWGPRATAAAPPVVDRDRIAGSPRWRPSSPLLYRLPPALSAGRLLFGRPAQANAGLVKGHPALTAEKLRMAPFRKIPRFHVILAAGRVDEDIANAPATPPDPPHEPPTKIHVHLPKKPLER